MAKSPPSQSTYNLAPNMISSNNSVALWSSSLSHDYSFSFDDDNHSSISKKKPNKGVLDLNENNISGRFAGETRCAILRKLQKDCLSLDYLKKK